MIDPKELWVGDLLQVISTGIVGKYERHKGSQVTLNCKGTRIMAVAQDLKIYKQPKEEIALVFEDEIDIGAKTKINDTIDLHIDRLAPHMSNQAQARILDFQIEKARTFVQRAIDTKRYQILIIHGKGTGLLKAEISEMLKDFSKVRYTFDKNDGGATEVWLDL